MSPPQGLGHSRGTLGGRVRTEPLYCRLEFKGRVTLGRDGLPTKCVLRDENVRNPSKIFAVLSVTRAHRRAFVIPGARKRSDLAVYQLWHGAI